MEHRDEIVEEKRQKLIQGDNQWIEKIEQRLARESIAKREAAEKGKKEVTSDTKLEEGKHAVAVTESKQEERKL